MSRIACIVFFALLVVPCISNAETIDVQIKGVDDGAKTTKQRDYKEAVLFAKREAIERAGVKIKSMTTVKDLVVNSDYIESQAEALLLPGYNILDMGYSVDGTYQIVLIGKVKTVSEGIDSKELRYAKSLMDRGEKAQTEKIITDIIKNSKDDNAVAEAMYYLIIWKFASDERDTFEKLKAYYPDSKYVNRIEAERRRIEAKREAEREAERRRITARDGTLVAYVTGVVYDKNTGLEWFAGSGGGKTWYEAMSWVKNFTVDGGGWRMPTITDLKTLYREGAGTRNRTPLLETTGWYVWSGEKFGSSSAWYFDFHDGWGHYDLRTTYDGYRVFAVRSASGEVTRGWLGVGIQDLSEELAEYSGIKDKKGVLITEVFPGDPADEAGIKPKDIVLSINGKKVENTRELSKLIADTSVGDTVKIKVLRNGIEKTFPVKIVKREDE